MKTILSITFFSLTICSFGQAKKFKNLNQYQDWIMNYYRHPEPNDLFDGFDYGVHNKKIAKAGNHTMIVAFFSSALRTDTLSQLAFYNKIGNTTDEDFTYAFGLTLWQIHSNFSTKLLDKFLLQDNIKKYKVSFDNIRAENYLDLWADEITNPEHLDMLWADFFATGNEESVKKIITKLSDLNSKNLFDVTTASSARWSLTSNASHHEKVLDICVHEKETADNKIQAALKQIIQSANDQKKSSK